MLSPLHSSPRATTGTSVSNIELPAGRPDEDYAIMDLIWAPHVIENISEQDLDLYLQFSSTACIPGGGCNVDEALHILYKANGDIRLAMQELLAYQNNCYWTPEEVKTFERLVLIYGKDFHSISRELQTKNVKECILFYYLWKKSQTRRPIHIPQDQHHQQPPPIQTIEPQSFQIPPQSFPCKVCGRIFEKVKSRSAHMKRHKNEV